LALKAASSEFVIQWSPVSGWQLEIGPGRVSPSYGVVVPTVRLLWRRTGPVPALLQLSIAPRASGDQMPALDRRVAATV
jgi:hypothetical protein